MMQSNDPRKRVCGLCRQLLYEPLLAAFPDLDFSAMSMPDEHRALHHSPDPFHPAYDPEFAAACGRIAEAARRQLDAQTQAIAAKDPSKMPRSTIRYFGFRADPDPNARKVKPYAD